MNNEQLGNEIARIQAKQIADKFKIDNEIKDLGNKLAEAGLTQSSINKVLIADIARLRAEPTPTKTWIEKLFYKK